VCLVLKADLLRSNKQLCDRMKLDVSGISSNCMDVQLTTVYVERFVSSIISFNDSMNNVASMLYFNEKKLRLLFLFSTCMLSISAVITVL